MHNTEQNRKLQMNLGKTDLKKEKRKSTHMFAGRYQVMPPVPPLHLQVLFQTCIPWSQEAGSGLPVILMKTTTSN